MAGMNLGQYIAEQVRGAINQALSDNQQQITDWFKDAGGNVTVNAGGASGSFLTLLAEILTTAVVTNPAVAVAVGGIEAAGEAAGGSGAGFGLGYFGAGLALQITQPFLAGAEYAVHAVAGDARLDPGLVASLLAKGIAGPNSGVMTATAAAQEVLDQGYTGGRLGQLVADAQAFPSGAEVFELWRRGYISDGQAAQYFERAKLNSNDAALLMQLKPNLPSPADLALGVLRGFIDPQVAKYGQGFGTTPNGIYGQTGYDMLGISDQDFQVLMDNTGEPPGLEEMLFMWRLGIFDQPGDPTGVSTLDHGIRQSRVRNEWIPYLHQFRYRPMSVADAARAVVQNFLPMADAQVIANQNGLTPADFPILVETQGRPLSHEQMLELFHRGKVTKAQVDQAFRESDLKDKYLTAAFELGRKLISERQIPQMLTYGVLTPDEAVDYLLKLGYSQQDAERLLDFGQAEHHAKLKELTVSEISTLYEDKVLSRDQAIDRLVFIGYPKDTAHYFLDLADIKAAAALAKLATANVKAAYLHGDITRDQAIDKLKAAGVEPFQATAMIDEYDIGRPYPIKDLSEAQTMKAATNGVISIQECANRLLALGYTKDAAMILLKNSGLVAYDNALAGVALPIPAGAVFGEPGGVPGGAG